MTTFQWGWLAGSVVTFKCGRYVESVDVEVLGMVETWERLKWAAITCGNPVRALQS